MCKLLYLSIKLSETSLSQYKDRNGLKAIRLVGWKSPGLFFRRQHHGETSPFQLGKLLDLTYFFQIGFYPLQEV
uniref:Uncharacterized protein n=1 Tax=Candidatus Kentrum sp. MB TaxID=2138164 RepID=A0A451B7C2_9GAMM|nr:MAG: hypothetical protein BECKMB1821G_GA0114241_100956 [Candidatus Kentron sp. MB]VFK34810.1 MAG: hypothetical protein BECKMB1821I_GA0114274_108512 [Candidatus Kentron sp. MB]VFK74188.1 MAG: hypothetical protein BECKMB1821H_GA0114242_10026 [Candidatus Kentron sp. MB]